MKRITLSVGSVLLFIFITHFSALSANAQTPQSTIPEIKITVTEGTTEVFGKENETPADKVDVPAEKIDVLGDKENTNAKNAEIKDVNGKAR